MQIEVYNTNNKPPVNGHLRDYCVEAGDTVDFLLYMQLMIIMIK